MGVDPWGGYNQGVALLNDTFNTARAQDRQSALDAQNAASARQQLAMGNVQLQSAQRQEQNRQDAVDAAANLQPSVRTTLYDQQGPPQPANNSAAPSMREALAQKLAQLRNQEYNPALTAGDNDVPPLGVDFPGANQGGHVLPQVADQQNQQAAALQAQIDAVPAQIPGDPLPQVAVEEQVPVTDADRIGAMIQSYMKNGEPEKAAALYKMAHEQAKTQGDMNAVGGGSLTDYYTKLAKASLTATQSEQIEKGLTTVASLAKEGPQYLKMAEPSIRLIPGFESFSADAVTVDPSKRFTSIDAGNGQTIIVDNQNPKDWKLEKKDPVTDFSSFHAGGIAKGLSEGQISQAWHDQKLAEQKAGRMMIVNNPIKSAGAGDVMTGANAGPLNAEGVNENALAGLDPGRAALVRKMAKYEMPLPTSRTKENLALMARVAAYDPSYDSQQYPLRQSLRKSFTSGVDAKNITSLNTAVHHLDQLDNSFTALGNRSMPAWNAIANKFESATGDPKLIRVVNDLNAVKGELAATFKGTGATDQEIKAWQDGFSSSSSPAQAKASVQEGVKLLQGRLDALIDKYQSGMGKSIDIPILSPKSLQTLQKLGVNVERYKALGGAAGQGANQGTPATPAHTVTKGGFKVTVVQ